jgi:predicted Rossmann fold flavoprotein
MFADLAIDLSAGPLADRYDTMHELAKKLPGKPEDVIEKYRYLASLAQRLKEAKATNDVAGLAKRENKTEAEISDFFMGHFAMFGHRSVYNSLIGIIHKKLLPVLLKEAGVDDIHKTCESLSFREKRNFCRLLKHWEFVVSGTNGLKNAQTTIGGVDTKDVNDETLESKIVSGLYFSGEVLDVDGDCGGFNLQWAWSSGYVAGRSAAAWVEI